MSKMSYLYAIIACLKRRFADGRGQLEDGRVPVAVEQVFAVPLVETSFLKIPRLQWFRPEFTLVLMMLGSEGFLISVQDSPTRIW